MVTGVEYGQEPEVETDPTSVILKGVMELIRIPDHLVTANYFFRITLATKRQGFLQMEGEIFCPYIRLLAMLQEGHTLSHAFCSLRNGQIHLQAKADRGKQKIWYQVALQHKCNLYLQPTNLLHHLTRVHNLLLQSLNFTTKHCNILITEA